MYVSTPGADAGFLKGGSNLGLHVKNGGSSFWPNVKKADPHLVYTHNDIGYAKCNKSKTDLVLLQMYFRPRSP